MSNGTTTAAPPTTSPPAAAAPATASTNWLVAGFDMLESINWAEVGDAFENATVGKSISTAEDVANAISKVLTVAGVPLAGTVSALLPLGEQVLNTIVSVVTGSGGVTSPAATAANTAVNGPAPTLVAPAAS
jgi:hypothetical protein